MISNIFVQSYYIEKKMLSKRVCYVIWLLKVTLLKIKVLHETKANLVCFGTIKMFFKELLEKINSRRQYKNAKLPACKVSNV